MFFLNPVMGQQLPVHQSMLTESPMLKGAVQRQKGSLRPSEALLRCVGRLTGGFAGLEGNSANLHPK